MEPARVWGSSVCLDESPVLQRMLQLLILHLDVVQDGLNLNWVRLSQDFGDSLAGTRVRERRRGREEMRDRGERREGGRGGRKRKKIGNQERER